MKLLPVIAVPITNDASKEDLTVTEVIKVVLPSSLERKGTMVVAETQDYPSKEGWLTVITKKGRQSIPPGALVVQGYYDIFNIVDLSEIDILAMHHMQSTEFANVGAGIGGGFKNTNKLRVTNYKKTVNGPNDKHWKAEVENKYWQMLANKVFEVVL